MDKNNNIYTKCERNEVRWICGVFEMDLLSWSMVCDLCNMYWVVLDCVKIISDTCRWMLGSVDIRERLEKIKYGHIAYKGVTWVLKTFYITKTTVVGLISSNLCYVSKRRLSAIVELDRMKVFSVFVLVLSTKWLLSIKWE